MKLKRREYLSKNNRLIKENIQAAIIKMRYPDKAIKARVDGLWLAVTTLFSVEIPIGIAILFTTICIILFFLMLLILLVCVLASFTLFICSVVSVNVATAVITVSSLAGISFFLITVLLFIIGILIICIVTRLWKLFFLLTEKTYKSIVLKYVSE